LGASYAIRPENGVGLFCIGTPPDPHGQTMAQHIQYTRWISLVFTYAK